jgi:cytochrome c553
MNGVAIALLGAAALAVGHDAYADADAAAGKEKAVVCAACHGATGTSVQDMWPNLASQRMGYIVKQLKAFRDGSRKDPVMAPMAQGLTDQDIDNLAAYFSHQAHAGAVKSQS